MKKDDLKILNRVYNSWPTDGIGISVNTVVILHWKYKTKNMVGHYDITDLKKLHLPDTMFIQNIHLPTWDKCFA